MFTNGVPSDVEPPWLEIVVKEFKILFTLFILLNLENKNC